MLDLVTRMLDSLGYAGVALLMFLENVLPPLPAELIMPLAGYEAAQGKADLWLVILAGSAGSLVGADVSLVSNAVLALAIGIWLVRVLRWRPDA